MRKTVLRPHAHRQVNSVEILCQGLAGGLRHHRHVGVGGVADGNHHPGAGLAEGGDLRAREREVDELDRGRLAIAIEIGSTGNGRNPPLNPDRPMRSRGCALEALEDLSAEIRRGRSDRDS